MDAEIPLRRGFFCVEQDPWRKWTTSPPILFLFGFFVRALFISA
jgi:hypothetical protein